MKKDDCINNLLEVEKAPDGAINKNYDETNPFWNMTGSKNFIFPEQTHFVVTKGGDFTFNDFFVVLHAVKFRL